MHNRLVPELSFPPYSYVTGRFPHPTRDPKGHSFGRSVGHVPQLAPACWETSKEYAYAIDLFNYGYYWEAHEAWEELWHACGRSGPTADFLKALIKFAAAGVKAREGRPEGVRRHARRAHELISALVKDLSSHEYCGLSLDGLLRIAEQLQTNPPAQSNLAAPVEVFFDFTLDPSLKAQQTDGPDRQ